MRIWDVRENAQDFRNPDPNYLEYGQSSFNGSAVAQENNTVAHFAVGKTDKWDNDEMALVV